MSVRIILTGFDAQRRQLRALPVDLANATRDEAAEPIADAAATAIAATYPRRSGELADAVRVDHVARGPVQAVARVVNTHPLASVFEHGTQARHTALGANRGSMPAGNVFIPIMRRARTLFWTKVVPIMERTGLTVTGRA